MAHTADHIGGQPVVMPRNMQAKDQYQYEQLMAQGLHDKPWAMTIGTQFQPGGDYSITDDTKHESRDSAGYLTYGQAINISDPSSLLAGFGITGADQDPEMLAMVQGFGDQYGWKTSQMKQNMYQGVGQAMGQTGSALGQMREQAASLASQSGLRRGRGAGVQAKNLYDQYQQGITGMRQQTQQGVEGLKHQWYDELTSTIAGIKAGQTG